MRSSTAPTGRRSSSSSEQRPPAQPVKKPFEGVIKELEREWKSASPWEKERFERYINLIPCPTCKGARLKKEMLWVRFGDLNIYQVTEMTIAECYRFFREIDLPEKEREISPGHPEGDRLPPEVPHRCRPRLHLPGAVLGDAVVRRIPADKARDPDRLRSDRRALRARRAEHRPPPAGQRAPPRARCRSCATSATRSSSSSTITTRSFAPIT